MLQPASEIARLKLALVYQRQAASTPLAREEGLAEKRRQAMNIYRKLCVKSKLLDSNRENSHQRWTQQLIYLLMSANSKSGYIRGIAAPAETVRHFHSPAANRSTMLEQRRASQKRRLP